MANEKRLIDANKALERADEVTFMGFRAEERKSHFMGLVSEILKQCSPVDAVEVVRCKDCAFCKVDNSVYMRDVFGNENDTPQYHCLMGYGYNKPDHFCSYGERREGE